MMHITIAKEAAYRTFSGLMVFACLSIIVLLLSAIFARALSFGICCGDDAAIAGAAKNLATGFGYSLSLTPTRNPGMILFDPAISTGPTLVIPTAILIAIAGADPRIPGVVASSTIIILVTILLLIHTHLFGLLRASAYIAFLLLTAFLLTPLNPEQWSALLGEIPSALLVVTGASILCIRSNFRIVIAGLCFGAAIQAKYISAIGAVSCMSIFMIIEASNYKNFYRIIFLIIFSIIPSFFIEIWTILSLGLNDYYEHLRMSHGFINLLGGNSEGLLNKFFNNNNTFSNHFSVSLFAIAVIGVFSLILAWLNEDRRVRHLALMLSAAAALHIIYWAFFSIGWPRYALVGLIYYAAAIATIVYSSALPRVLPALICATFLLVHGDRAKMAFDLLNDNLSTIEPRPQMQALIDAAAFARSLDPTEPFVTISWASGGDLEYMLPTGNISIPFDQNGYQNRILVQNLIFTSPPYSNPLIEEILKRCGSVLFQQERYMISKCD